MSDTPIEKMDFKQLRNEVQLLRDEIAIFMRKYEDMIYNLDNDNFSGRIVKEKDDMKAELKITAEEISSRVSNGEFESYKSQTAEEISSKVDNDTFTSAISQTADKISSIICERIDTSQAVKVSSTAYFKDKSKIYAIDDKFYRYDTISNNWRLVKDGETVNSIFEQTADGFTLDGAKTTFTGVVYLTDRTKNKTRAFSIFFDDSQGGEEVILHNSDGKTSRPLVLGDLLDTSGYTHTVYIGSSSTGNEVATKAWVNKKSSPTAVFG